MWLPLANGLSALRRRSEKVWLTCEWHASSARTFSTSSRMVASYASSPHKRASPHAHDNPALQERRHAASDDGGTMAAHEAYAWEGLKQHNKTLSLLQGPVHACL